MFSPPPSKARTRWGNTETISSNQMQSLTLPWPSKDLSPNARVHCPLLSLNAVRGFLTRIKP
ncbi:hypothetical protein EIP73_09250 [Xylella fastidiosa subsp. pauca]|nr:hypothetical protein EIP73_09250 [Xylella fastidiosa subsp. pauca]